MCGINGIIDYHKHYSMEERNKLVHQMNEKIIYRGPNMQGISVLCWKGFTLSGQIAIINKIT